MTRLDDRYVVQRVGDDGIVLVDDATGAEVMLPMATAERLHAALPYLLDPGKADTSRRWIVAHEGGDLLVTVFLAGGPALNPAVAANLSIEVAHRIDHTRWGAPLPAEEAP